MSERTLSDAEALDQIAKRYTDFGQYDMFECMDSSIEAIGDIVERTGRTVWVETPDADPWFDEVDDDE